MTPLKFAAACIATILSASFLPTAATAGAPFSMKNGYRSAFHIGAALDSRVFVNEDPVLSDIVTGQCSLIVAGNELKWESLHPAINRYDFSKADSFVNWGERNGMQVHGHVLVWHSQTPASAFKDASGRDVSRDVMIERMQDHIRTVMGRYKGRIQTWDVVNEAFNDDGTMRDSPWSRIIGRDFIEIAFRTAREVDPSAMLVYNDYSWVNPAKRAGILAHIRELLAKGVPIDALGIQGHWQLGYPSIEQVDATLWDLASTGLKILITELDIDVLPTAWDYTGADINVRFELQDSLNPYRETIPPAVLQQQAERYAALFTKFLEYKDFIHTVTFWGITDQDSWLNNFPVRGRTNYPMAYNRNNQPKPAYFAIMNVAPDPLVPAATSTDPYVPIPLHRFHRKSNNSHFFTVTQAEFNALSADTSGTWVYEGPSHHVIGNHTQNSTPVYRLFNRVSGSHFYTATKEEMVSVLADPSSIFNYEGIAFWVLLAPIPGAQPVYRFFAPPSGSHFFTINEQEKDVLRATVSPTQLSYDGVAWFAFP